MIEQRKLSQEELDLLIIQASDSESRWIKAVCMEMRYTPYELFKRYALDWDGLVINGRPVYVAGIFCSKGVYEFWTVVNKDVKEQLSLFKCAKKGLKRWLEYIPAIHATMMKSWEKNVFWTERLGFKRCREVGDTITFVIKKDKER